MIAPAHPVRYSALEILRKRCAKYRTAFNDVAKPAWADAVIGGSLAVAVCYDFDEFERRQRLIREACLVHSSKRQGFGAALCVFVRNVNGHECEPVWLAHFDSL